MSSWNSNWDWGIVIGKIASVATDSSPAKPSSYANEMRRDRECGIYAKITKQSISLEYCAEPTQRESIIGDDMTRCEWADARLFERVEVERKLRERKKHLNIWILIRNSGEERESVYSIKCRRKGQRTGRWRERRRRRLSWFIYFAVERRESTLMCGRITLEDFTRS